MLYMAVIGLLLGRGSCFQSENNFLFSINFLTLSLDRAGFFRRGIALQVVPV